MAKLNPDYIKWVLTLNASQAQEEFHKLEKANKDLQKETNATRKAMAQLESEGKKGTTEWENLRKSISQNSRVMSEYRAKMGEVFKQIDAGAMTVNELRKHLKNLKTEFNNTSKAAEPQRYKELQKQISDTEQAIHQATGATGELKGGLLSLSNLKNVVSGFFMSIGASILTEFVGALKNATSTIIDFEKANSKLAAILGTSSGGIAKLTEQAKYLGRTTTATAAEVTGLQTELAKLGFSQEIIEKMTPATLKFAKAVDTDLSSAAAFAGAALRMFNKDASDAEELMATFAIATTRSALDFHKLETSLATVGPVANAFGFSVEETTALLGILANAGFDASSAATATRNIILNLCDANGELAQALGQPVTNLNELVAGLNKLNAEGVDLAKVLELTDKRSVAVFSSFLQGSDSILELRDAITGATDDFNKMAATMVDNASGAAKGFESAVEGLILKFFDFHEMLKYMFQMATAVTQWLGELVDALSATGSVLETLLRPIGFLLSVLGSLVVEFAKFITQTKLGRAMVNGIVTALVLYKTATLLASTATRTFMLNVVASSKAALVYVGSLFSKVKALFASAAASVKAAIATRTFNAALLANPIMLVVGTIATLVAAIMGYNSIVGKSAEKTSYLAEVNKKCSKAMEDVAVKVATERDRLMELRRVAMSELESKENRIKAINELNRIVPDYNGFLDVETGKYRENKKALDDYIVSLEKKLRIEANKSIYQELLDADAKTRHLMYKMRQATKDQADKYEGLKGANLLSDDPWGHNYAEAERLKKMRPELEIPFSEWYESQNTETTQAIKQFKAYLSEMGLDVEMFAEDVNNTIITTSTNTANKVVTRIQEIDKELKRLRKINPESDEELDRIQKRIKLLQQEKKELLGNSKNKRAIGTYREDSLDEATADADNLHQKNMLEINKQKGQISDTEFIIKKNQELIRYSTDLIKALENLRGETDATHTQTLDKIDAEQNKILQDALAAQQAINAATVKQSKEHHDNKLNALTAGYELEKNIQQKAVNDQKITQEQADIYMMARERQLHEDQLAELRRYYAEVKNSDLMGAAERTKTLEDLDVKIRQMTSQTLTDAGKWSEKIRELSTATSGAAGIKTTFDWQVKALNGTYDQAIAIQKQLGQDTTALEAEKQRRIAALNYQYQEQMWQLQENVGLSWADEYDRELASLKNMHEQGLISEKQYQNKKLELGINNAKKYFDYYSQLSGSMISAIQEAEIAQVDAKYDVLIQQAKNNGEDTAALEEEKENKKLEIQKKYADVDFAIKISEIIANTAVAIMTGFKQLGPIAGAVAAAMLTATGIAQIAAAKAERDKVKNMQPGATAGASTSPATAERVLSGYSEGGYTGDGNQYEVAGVVHRGEYVVPMPIMDDPRVIDAVGMIESIRRNRTPRPVDDSPRMSPGFADGGYTGDPISVDTSDLLAVVKELKVAVQNIRAYVVLKDIKKAEEDWVRARRPFTRNN